MMAVDSVEAEVLEVKEKKRRRVDIVSSNSLVVRLLSFFTSFFFFNNLNIIWGYYTFFVGGVRESYPQLYPKTPPR